MLRVHVVAPENVRIGNLMLDQPPGARRRPAAAARTRSRRTRSTARPRFGKTRATADLFDLVLNAETLTAEQMADLIETAVCTRSRTHGARLSLGSRRAAASISDAVQAGALWHRAARQGDVCGRKSSRIPAKRCSPTCWTSIASPGSTSRAAFRSSRTATGACWKPSRPISTCRSSTFTWNSPR